MTGYRISPLALDDLEGIDLYISEDNPRAATAVMDTIFEAFERLAEEPGIGHARSDLTALPVRFWTVAGRYMVVYRDLGEVIEIVHVIGGGRDVAAILGR